MRKLFTLTLLLMLATTLSFAQRIEPLKLTDQEVTDDYKRVESLLCKSTQAAILYKSPEMYSMILGDVVEKGYQSFEKKGDSGTVLYMVFDQDITDNAFIPGLLWGSAGKPTKSHPEEYLAKGKILIIWSFDRNSTIKKLSREKVAHVL